MNTDISEFRVLWKLFFGPEEGRILVLRPCLSRSATKAVYEDDVGNRLGERPVDGRQT